jgi:hypothetical protein
MSTREPLVRNISDTALLAAIYRARETERPDAVFRDPFARRLAGERGDQIAKSMPFSERATWAWITRTYAYDEFIKQQIREGVDMVVNLAAGLDARPYRMNLPASLHWIEVDLPGILDYKEEILRGEKPTCILDRARLDLSGCRCAPPAFRGARWHREERPHHDGRTADLLLARRGRVSSAGPRGRTRLPSLDHRYCVAWLAEDVAEGHGPASQGRESRVQVCSGGGSEVLHGAWMGRG